MMMRDMKGKLQVVIKQEVGNVQKKIQEVKTEGQASVKKKKKKNPHYSLPY